MSAVYCSTCGKSKSELSESTFYIPLTGLARFVGWIVAALMVLYATRHPGTVLHAALLAAVHLLAFLFGVTPCSMFFLVDRVISWILVLLVFSYFLPGALGPGFRKLMVQALTRIPRLFGKCISITARLVWRLVEGSHSEKTSSKKRK